MAQKYSELNESTSSFIQQQHFFVVATADRDGKVIISPKALDSFRIINNNKVMWLNLTSSGSETAAHILSSPRMIIMFMVLNGNPMILRLYGQAKAIHRNNEQWESRYSQFDKSIGARQIFVLDIDLEIISCGMSVPLFEFKQQREQLPKSSDRKGVDGIESYCLEKNKWSIDGQPTKIDENL